MSFSIYGKVRHVLLASVLVVCVLLIGSPACWASPELFEIDPAQSRVEFTLGDILHTVHGNFQLKSGSIRFDSATGTASGELVVDATTGNTGNKGRDRKMHQQILESRKYPDIIFAVQHIQGTVPPAGSSQVRLQGMMTVHGQAHPMTLSVPVEVTENRAAADVRFVVPYVAWGMKNPSTFLLRVDDKVQITVHAVGRLSSQ